MTEAADLVRSEAWRELALPDRVTSVPTMLSRDESRLLYGLSCYTWRGAGRIVDAGSFLGGSTVALAQGLRDAGKVGQLIDAYDRFIVERYTLAEHWFDGRGLRRGDSFRPMFDEHLAGLNDLVKVHEGDVAEQRFDQPIEILFLDVLKSWTINDVVCERTFPLLTSGAIVIQQDYWSGTLPWIQVMMSALDAHFERLVDVGGSRAFAVTKPVTVAAVEACRRGRINGSDLVATFDRLIADEADSTHRGLLELNKAQMLLREVGSKEFRAVMDRVDREWADDPIVSNAAARVHGFLFPGALHLADALRFSGLLRR